MTDAIQWNGNRSVVVGLESANARRRLLVGLLVASVLLVLALMQVDDWIRLQRSRLPERTSRAVAEVVSRTADGFYLFPAAGAVVLGFQVAKRRRAARLVMILVLGGLLTGLVANLFRSLIGRTRPEAPVEQGWFGPLKEGHWIAGRYAYSSFPSGHTSSAAGFGLALILLGRRMAACGFAYAVLVGWSRVQLGVHRPSDVAAGLCLGLLLTILMTPAYEHWLGRPRMGLGDWVDGLTRVFQQRPPESGLDRKSRETGNEETPEEPVGTGPCPGLNSVTQ
jgi:membrane-associated phospholipid phosphatase